MESQCHTLTLAPCPASMHGRATTQVRPCTLPILCARWLPSEVHGGRVHRAWHPSVVGVQRRLVVCASVRRRGRSAIELRAAKQHGKAFAMHLHPTLRTGCPAALHLSDEISGSWSRQSALRTRTQTYPVIGASCPVHHARIDRQAAECAAGATVSSPSLPPDGAPREACTIVTS